MESNNLTQHVSPIRPNESNIQEDKRENDKKPPLKKECKDTSTPVLEGLNVKKLLLQQKDLMNDNISHSSNDVKSDEEDSEPPIDNESLMRTRTVLMTSMMVMVKMLVMMFF